MTNPEDSIQALGGKARAKKLSPTQLSESARAAAVARWEKAGSVPLPKATHEGILEFGDIEISCYVLSDGTRVLSQRALADVFGLTHGGGGSQDDGGQKLPRYLGSKALVPFMTKELTAGIYEPIKFTPPRGGASVSGIVATALPDVCNVWLRAREAGALKAASLLATAQKAEVLVRSLASVGIIALVDEATGFQYDRPRRDLEEQLKKFLAESLRQWVRTFPAEYFKQLCRLRGIELRPDMKLPQYFGMLTNNLVYRRIAPGLLKKLKERKLERGNPSNKLHSWLSEDVGFRAVLVHLGLVVGIMKLNTDYKTFEKQLDQVAPIYPEIPGLFDNPKDWEEPTPTG